MDITVTHTISPDVKHYPLQREADCLMEFNPHEATHVEGFVSLLREQGVAHNEKITRERALAVANSIGQEFQVTFISTGSNGAKGVIKGMTTATESDYAGGNFLFLEDIVVTESARQQGYGRLLMCGALLDAWETGKKGFGWEIGRNNTSAQYFYQTIDPEFDSANLHNVWKFSARQMADIAKDSRLADTAFLALPDDMNAVSNTLQNRANDAKDLGYISRILQRQETNGIDAKSFVVISSDGSFAISSVAYSTFLVSRRADIRFYLSPEAKPQDVAGLIKASGQEIARRKWRGHTHIEFGNQVTGLSATDGKAERRLVQMASKEFQRIGGDVLAHNGAPMVPYYLDGKRYVEAVDSAVKLLGSRNLSVDGRKRLDDALMRYGLVAA
jgi:GNAT superfamily N-acetyltransferase